MPIKIYSRVDLGNDFKLFLFVQRFCYETENCSIIKANDALSVLCLIEKEKLELEV